MQYSRLAFFLGMCLGVWATNLRALEIGDTISGERLDPATYGPGIIETMDQVVARDRSSPPAQLEESGFRVGEWYVPSLRATYFPHSGSHNIINKNGDTRMGISFPGTVTVHGAFIAGQGTDGVWTPGIRAIGFREGREVKSTSWFYGISDNPQWFEMDLQEVDRIVVESIPIAQGGGWYGLDDLTYSTSDPAANPMQARTVIDFEDLPYGQDLTSSNYAGLTWELGSGVVNDCGDAIHAPIDARPPSAGGKDQGIDEGLPEGGFGTAPNLALSFEGVRRFQVSGSFPPDTCGAVGPNHFVEVVNNALAIYSKTTGTLATPVVTLTSFLPGSSGDPRVLFDQHSNRWFILNDDFNDELHIAVSLTSSATGSWFKTKFLAKAGSDANCWPDYPTWGVDANGLYTSAYMVGCGMTIFAINKAPLIAPAPSLGTVTAFRGLPLEGAIQPCHTYGTPPGEYFVSTGSDSSLNIRRVNPPLTAPTLTTLPSVTVGQFLDPFPAAVQGSASLDTVGTRIMNAVYRDGFIYAAHTIRAGAGAACKWYKLAEGSPFTVSMSGVVGDQDHFYFFPSIAVNSLGHLAMAFSGSNANQFAACYYSGRLVNDPAGEMGEPVLLKAGEAAQSNIDNAGRNRWGDYSLTSLDPADDLTFWTVQEYAEGPPNQNNTWGTWIGKLTFTPVDSLPPQPAPTFEIPPTAIDTTSITMRSTEATDASSPPVEYVFDYTSGLGGHDSGWQASRDYTDTGLAPNSFYNYRIKVRDSASPNPNEAVPSAPVLGGTAIETPIGVTFGTVTETSIEVFADGSFTNVGLSNTGFFYEMAPAEGSGANSWVTGVNATGIIVTGLTPGVTYSFRVKARNFQGMETPFTATADQATPGGCALLGDVNDDGVLDGLDVDAFTRVKLGVPLETDVEECANYQTGTLEGDTSLFVNDLIGN